MPNQRLTCEQTTARSQVVGLVGLFAPWTSSFTRLSIHSPKIPFSRGSFHIRFQSRSRSFNDHWQSLDMRLASFVISLGLLGVAVASTQPLKVHRKGPQSSSPQRRAADSQISVDSSDEDPSDLTCVTICFSSLLLMLI